jgi:hypothetical protein
MQIDRQEDMTKVIDAFRNFAHTHKKFLTRRWHNIAEICGWKKELENILPLLLRMAERYLSNIETALKLRSSWHPTYQLQYFNQKNQMGTKPLDSQTFWTLL